MRPVGVAFAVDRPHSVAVALANASERCPGAPGFLGKSSGSDMAWRYPRRAPGPATRRLMRRSGDPSASEQKRPVGGCTFGPVPHTSLLHRPNPRTRNGTHRDEMTMDTNQPADTPADEADRAWRDSLGTTADGVPVVDGLVVFTNEMRPGVINLAAYRPLHDGWFDVDYPDGGVALQNGERVATRFEGRSATAAYNDLQQAHTAQDTAQES